VEFRVLDVVPAEDVRELLSIARRRTFRREEVVFHQGDPADSLHLIVKGHFAVRILTPLGHTAMLAVHGPGEAFGELALLSQGASRSATVSALEPCETFSVLRGEFFRVCQRHPGVKDVLLALLAEQIRRANERIVVAHYLDADARVRWALLELVAAYETGDDETTIPLTQEQLAEIAGTTRPTVNRVLRDEEQLQTVAVERGRVRVISPAGLAQRVRGLPRL
jgi:CRP/FNR family transcriptional regulator, cyclic AMP receptor protein